MQVNPPFPLWALLTIYAKAEDACYTNYMTGFKELVSYLGPIINTSDSLSGDDYNYSILGNYLTQRMHDILGIHEDTILNSFVHEVLPRLNKKST